MSTSTELNKFQRSYEIEPIILVGGIAASYPNHRMSILGLTEANAFVEFGSVQNYFAQFKIVSGSTLQDWGIAEYPFVSLVMAANAQIKNPLRVSLLMQCPANTTNHTYTQKQSRFSIIKNQLDAHVAQGGVFTVLTPAYTYQNCLLVKLTDVSSGADRQVQMAYQWDFVQPLITQEAATMSYNGIYNQLANNLPTSNPVNNSGKQNVLSDNSLATPIPMPQFGVPDLSGLTTNVPKL